MPVLRMCHSVTLYDKIGQIDTIVYDIYGLMLK